MTGANGLVGSWLIKDLLAAGAQVTAFIRDEIPGSELYRSGDISRVNVVRGCVEDLCAIERAVNQNETDVIFHLAAQTIVGAAYRAPLDTLESNVRGTYNLLEACRRHKDMVKGVVVASSDKAYGPNPYAYEEHFPLQGRFPYDASKACADILAQSYAATYQMPIAIARCGNIYGGGDLNWSRIVPGTVRSFYQQQPPLLRSNGKFVRDYIYVKDVCDGYMRLADFVLREKASGEQVNFSYEQPMAVLEVVKAIAGVMDSGHIEPRILNNAPGEILSQALNSQKAKRVLGWAPRFTLQEGLRETVDWYRNFLQHEDPHAEIVQR